MLAPAQLLFESHFINPGSMVGSMVGWMVGSVVGSIVGSMVGATDGILVGATDGIVGISVGGDVVGADV